MRLAAVYIPENSLPYIFGDNHKGQTINLGGQFFYEVIENKNELIIEKTPNSLFIDNFWGEEISMISAMVGKNGIGKTSILRALHSVGDKKKKELFYLFEAKDFFYYYNELETKKISSDFKINEITSNALGHVKHYYTPIVDIEQLNTLSQLGLVSTGEENLKQLYLKQLLQDVILLNDPLKNILKSVYPDFPEYKELEIKVSQHRKFDFKNVYATANLGNQDRVNVLKIYIESDLRDLEEGKWKEFIGEEFIKSNILERYINIINSSGLNSLFDRFWDLKDNQHNTENDNIHGESNFIENFEVTLFTYFILDATFPQTPFQANVDFQNILNYGSFEEGFDAFFDMYMLSIYGLVRDNFNEKLGRVSIVDYDEIKKIINEAQHKSWIQQGFKSSDAIKLMLRYLERFKAFFDLYSFLKKIISENRLETKGDSLIYRLEEHEEKDFYDLIELYNNVLSLTGNFVYRLDLLSIRSIYPLSSGEKALLNFFARINNRIDGINNSNHPVFNYYLLLLDEPELGYHPVWKRKFVDAITKSIPVLFGKLNPTKDIFDKNFFEVSNIKTQIIFTTHDPLTLSDIPQNNVIYLDKENNGSTFVNHNKVKTFGANVHDLLADSFFLEEGFMGEFAEEWITDLITYLTFDSKQKVNDDNKPPKRQWDKNLAQKIIQTVDEPLIKERLTNLFDKKFIHINKGLLEAKIKELNILLKRIENEED
ncbi:AAA family ATPase [Leeuwenhoekiella sp. A16]|uniref:AAA family ATPase n=1 Tax=Leeuwenhoekiella sp. A16 TaxID=3141462 RepID=UPI003A807881